MIGLLLIIALMKPSNSLPADTIYQIDPVIVVGRREPIRLSRLVNSAISLSPQQNADASQDNVIKEFVDNDASVSMSAVNGYGYGLGSRGQGQISIRGLGFSPNRGVLVLIDGRPDIAGLFGHPLPDTYRRAGIYSADLIKGAASTEYGSNALAGVLDLTSFYRPDLDHYSNLELSCASHKTCDVILQHSQYIGSSIVAGWYEYLRTDNQRPESDYENRSGGFRLQNGHLAGFETFLSGQYSSFHFSDPGPIYKPSAFTGDIRRMGMTFGLDRRRDALSLSARFYTSYGEHAFSDHFHSLDRNNGLDIFARIRHRVGNLSLALTGGTSINYLGGSAYDGTAFVRHGNFHESEYALHLQTELDYASLARFTVGGRLIDHNRYSDHFVYQAGLVISPGQAGSIKFSVATAYRNPAVNETQLFKISNGDSLRPEDGAFYELGYYRKIGSALALEGALFWRKGNNLIASVSNPNPPPTTLFVNTGKYDHSGWETALRYSVNHLNIAPSYVHLNQHSYNLSVPDDRIVLTASWRETKWLAGFDFQSALKTHSDSAGTPVILENYLVVNANAACALSRILRLSLNLDNLFDTEYEIVHGYPMPGISIRIGLALTLQ